MEKFGVRGGGGKGPFFKYLGGPVSAFFVDMQLGGLEPVSQHLEDSEKFSTYVVPILENNGLRLEDFRTVVLAGTGMHAPEVEEIFDYCPNLEDLWLVEPSNLMVENHLKPVLGGLPPEQQGLCTLYESRIQDASEIPDGSVDFFYAAHVFGKEIIPSGERLASGRSVERMLAPDGVFVEVMSPDDDFNRIFFGGGMKQLGRNSLGGGSGDLRCPLSLKIFMKRG